MGMLQMISKWGDSYDREARLYPSLLTILPVLVLLICVFGSKHPLLTSAASLLIACGAPLFLERIARDLGKALEERLFVKWGEKPTTILLRHKDTVIDAITKKKYHATIALAIGKSAPTNYLEEKNPEQADTFYRAGTAWLIANTQETNKHPFVFRENKYYGFQRNLRGLKWIGIMLSSLALVISVLHFYLHNDVTQGLSHVLRSVAITDVLPIATNAAMLLCWVFLVTEESVRRAGFAYADRLIRACDALGAKTKRKKED